MKNKTTTLGSLITLGFIMVVMLTNCSKKARQSGSDRIQLFNGEDLSGWTAKFTGFPAGENYKNTFRVEDGILKVSYENWDSIRIHFPTTNCTWSIGL